MKNEEIEVDEAMAMRPSNMKKKAKLNAALKRLEDMKVASKMKEEVEGKYSAPQPFPSTFPVNFSWQPFFKIPTKTFGILEKMKGES